MAHFTSYGEALDGAAVVDATAEYVLIEAAEEVMFGAPIESAICKTIDENWRRAEALASGALPSEL